MENTNKKPLLQEEVNLQATSGIYSWYTKTVLKLYCVAIAILKAAAEGLKKIPFDKLVSCIWVVNHKANKLEGICSISSSVHDNIFCKARRLIKDCICSHCYAHNQQAYQTGLKEHNILNGIILRNILIPVKAFKLLVIIFPSLRIESFGDVQNVIQARNYIRIIKAFPRKRCAIWSKNLLIWEQAFMLEGKPNNTTYVHSSSKVNVVDVIDTKRFYFVDHVFTVFDKKYAKQHNIIINCGGRKCMDCIRKRINCYFRNTEFYINEGLK